MRADEKMRMETVEEEGRNGKVFKKTVIVQPKDLPVAERWVPIVEKRFPYELSTSLLLTPTAPGLPIPIKLQEQHRPAVPLDESLSEETGRALAMWARGGSATGEKSPAPAADTAKPQTGRERLMAAARVEARKGNDALRAFREGLTPQQDGALSPILSELDRIACNADAADDGFPGFDAPHEKAA